MCLMADQTVPLDVLHPETWSWRLVKAPQKVKQRAGQNEKAAYQKG